MSTQDEMNLVYATASEFAFEQIAEHGNFIPFAVVIDRNGNLAHVALGEDIVEDGGVKALAKVCQILRAGAKQGEYRAIAVTSDVRVRLEESGEVTDAIRVEVEHIQYQAVT